MVLSHAVLSHFSEELCEVEISCDRFLSTEKTGSTKGRGLCRTVILQRGPGPHLPTSAEAPAGFETSCGGSGCQLGPVVSCCLISSFLKEGKALFKELGAHKLFSRKMLNNSEWDVFWDSANQHFRCSARIYGSPPMCQAPVECSSSHSRDWDRITAFRKEACTISCPFKGFSRLKTGFEKCLVLSTLFLRWKRY